MNNARISYDLIVIGAGPGGYAAAIRAAQDGARTALIEKDRAGGACLHRGCIPSKSYIHSTKILKTLREASAFGIEWEGEPRPSLERIRERTFKVIDSLEKGIHHLLRSHGVDFLQGAASFAAPDRIRLTEEAGSRIEYTAQKSIIATGSAPGSLPLFRDMEVLTTDSVFSLSKIPSSITIIGGGAAGCEFAGIFCAMGSRVTIIEMEPRLLPGQEPEIVQILAREFKKKKIRFLCGEKAAGAAEKGGRKVIYLESGEEITSDHVLVTIGRRPNTGNLNLEGAGVERGRKGNVLVNKKMETSVAGIYAVGDVTGNRLLAHVASREGIVAAENAAGRNTSMDYSAIPSVVFTDPEIASVGLSAAMARSQGRRVRPANFPFRALGMSRVMNALAGEVRLTVEEDTGMLLGAHMMGPHASELIHEAALAVSKGLTIHDIGNTVHAHPTLSEAMMEAAWAGLRM